MKMRYLTLLITIFYSPRKRVCFAPCNSLNAIEEEIATSLTLFAPRNDDATKYYIPPQIPLLFHQLLHSGGSGSPEPVAANLIIIALHVGDG